MVEKSLVSTSEIQETMAAKRASLRENIYHMEKEVEKKVLDTVDQVQHKVLAATDAVTQKVTRPVYAVQEKIEAVPRALHSAPMKTVLTIAAVGVTLGFLFGRRGRHRHHMTRALLATAAPRAMQKVEKVKKPAVEKKSKLVRGFFASIATEAAHQLFKNSLTGFLRRRA
jgi:ElaB/YqjD/DUF883 family membrane-anchored ribosome-binding protein